MIEENEYLRLAERELVALVQAVDDLGFDDIDCEFSEGIVTLEFSDGGSYVVNSHRAARQIWMAAERTAWHFDWDPTSGTWTAAKSGDELWSALCVAMSKKLKQDVQLNRPAF